MAEQGLPQIQVLEDSVRDRGEVTIDNETEQTPLLGHIHHNSAAGSRSKLLRRTCCVKSKAATAILCWNLLVAFVIGYVLQLLSLNIFDRHIPLLIAGVNMREYVPLVFGSFALLYLFYPLAGCLADVKFGRYKTIFCSQAFSTVSALIACVASAITIY